MNHDIVIATRNRPEVLGLSIPTYLNQNRRPKALIVVDSSDDPAPVRRQVEAATAGADDVRVEVHHTAPGLTAQRMVGLSRVESPVVMFPDDDSLWYPGAAEAIMRVYERDADGVIGGVGTNELRSPPPGVLGHDGSQDQRSVTERLIYRLSPVRARVENFIAASPMERIGHDLMHARPKPAWLEEVAAETVPFIHGFRMSFRTDAIRDAGGFDTGLRAYALYEDFDASYKVAARSLLTTARDAHVYHHRQAGKRGDGRSIGVMLMLNLAYVTCRHSDPGSKPRRMLRPYARLRYMQYLPRSRDAYGRERLEGFKAAMGCLDEMIATPRDTLPDLYQQLVARCMEKPAARNGSRGKA